MMYYIQSTHKLVSIKMNKENIKILFLKLIFVPKIYIKMFKIINFNKICFIFILIYI